MQSHAISVGRRWKLRRIYANLRQQDVASGVGISSTRYSSIERSELEPTDLERELIEALLPELPSCSPSVPKNPESFRPDESRRRELARRWLRLAHGESPESKE